MTNEEKFSQAYDLLAKQSYREAFNIFQELSRDSYPLTDHFLAWMYEQGLGTDKDDEKAFEYYLFSAKAGYGVSQCGIGMYYLNGNVVEQNLVKAYYWFSLSAKYAEKDPDSECGAKAELQGLERKLTKEQLSEVQQLLKP